MKPDCRTRAQIATVAADGQCPNLLRLGAPLPRRTAVQQHRRHQIRTLPADVRRLTLKSEIRNPKSEIDRASLRRLLQSARFLRQVPTVTQFNHSLTSIAMPCSAWIFLPTENTWPPVRRISLSWFWIWAPP